MTISLAAGQASITVRTLRVAGSMTLMELPARFATTTDFPLGATRRATGSSPTPTRSTSRRDLRSMTEIVFEPELAT